MWECRDVPPSYIPTCPHPYTATSQYFQIPMTLSLSLAHPDTLIVHLREGAEETEISVRPAAAGARSLLRALDDALTDGYGECFWPGSPGGQYWWIFKRDAESIEVVAMWTRGGATGWEHTFRATDAASWVEEQLTTALDRLGLRLAS